MTHPEPAPLSAEEIVFVLRGLQDPRQLEWKDPDLSDAAKRDMLRLLATIDAQRAEISALGGAMRADEERLRDAERRVWPDGSTHGCDAPEWMADEIENLKRERDEAREFGEQAAAKYNALLEKQRILRCAFCDHEYPPGTPPTQHEALTAHILECPKHPLLARIAELEAEVERLKAQTKNDMARIDELREGADATANRASSDRLYADSKITRALALAEEAIGELEVGSIWAELRARLEGLK